MFGFYVSDDEVADDALLLHLCERRSDRERKKKKGSVERKNTCTMYCTVTC